MNTIIKFLICALLALKLEASPSLHLESLMLWDRCVNELTKISPLFDRGKDRLCAYLFHAQKIAFDRNENMDLISVHVIQLFYPKYGQGIFSYGVLNPLYKRFHEEESKIHPIVLTRKGGGWIGNVPYHGLEIPTWKPWRLKSAYQYRLEAPPTDEGFWKDQLFQVKQEMHHATDKQKERIKYWAGMPSALEGNWLIIANEYMKGTHVPLETQIEVRDALGRVIVDSTVAAFDSKYTYLIKRPDMIDPELITYIPTPNHPSFPSAHSTVSSAVVEVLNHYFPQNKSEWNRLLEEAGMSRIWAGLHFPIDHKEGMALGKKVGQNFLKQ